MALQSKTPITEKEIGTGPIGTASGDTTHRIAARSAYKHILFTDVAYFIASSPF
jgi:hypothetical protein